MAHADVTPTTSSIVWGCVASSSKIEAGPLCDANGGDGARHVVLRAQRQGVAHSRPLLPFPEAGGGDDRRPGSLRLTSQVERWRQNDFDTTADYSQDLGMSVLPLIVTAVVLLLVIYIWCLPAPAPRSARSLSNTPAGRVPSAATASARGGRTSSRGEGRWPPC